MPARWNWPKFPHRAIIAAVAAFLLIVEGVVGAAARPAGAELRVSGVSAAAGERLCVVGDAGQDAPAAPLPTHPDHCRQIESCCAVFGVALAEIAEDLAGASIIRAGAPLPPEAWAPVPASGWRSSWSSRAPPSAR